jgi:hypothetical protein
MRYGAFATAVFVFIINATLEGVPASYAVQFSSLWADQQAKLGGLSEGSMHSTLMGFFVAETGDLCP